MNGLIMLLIAIVFLSGGYLIYGRWLEKTWGIDPRAKTPAYEMRDGVDYEPADTPIVFGHQFASIAGAGPINGPIQAAVFGWVPVLLWVLIGVVFFFASQITMSFMIWRNNGGRHMWAGRIVLTAAVMAVLWNLDPLSARSVSDRDFGKELHPSLSKP